MASLLPNIPLEYMNPRQKYALMNYLVRSNLPARVARQVLQEWGNALFVEITSTDYDLLNNHSLVTPVPPEPGSAP